MDVRASLAKIPLRDRVVYGIVMALFLGGLVVQPLWRALDPSMVLSARFAEDTPDPWGQPFEILGGANSDTMWLLSAGPNGVVDGPGGDDIEFPFGLRHQLYANASTALTVLAGVLAFLWELIRWSRKALARPKAGLPTEIALASGLAAFPSVVVFGVGWWVVGLLDRSAVSAIEDALIVPLPVALAGSAFGLTLMGFVYLRTRQPGASSAGEASEPG